MLGIRNRQRLRLRKRAHSMSALQRRILGWACILNPILLLVGVFVLGLGFAVNAPIWASLVPQLVTDQELPSALTLGGVQLNISGILGPALAGIILAKVEAPFVFGLNAAGFLLVFMAIPALPKTGCALGRTLISFVLSLRFPFVTSGRPKMYETSFFEMRSSVFLLLSYRR